MEQFCHLLKASNWQNSSIKIHQGSPSPIIRIVSFRRISTSPFRIRIDFWLQTPTNISWLRLHLHFFPRIRLNFNNRNCFRLREVHLTTRVGPKPRWENHQAKTSLNQLVWCIKALKMLVNNTWYLNLLRVTKVQQEELQWILIQCHPYPTK